MIIIKIVYAFSPLKDVKYVKMCLDIKLLELLKYCYHLNLRYLHLNEKEILQIKINAMDSIFKVN